jgi:ribosomal protein S27E
VLEEPLMSTGMILLSGLWVGSCPATDLGSTAYAQGGLEQLLQKQQPGDQPLVSIGLTLTVVSLMLYLLVILAAASKQKQPTESQEAQTTAMNAEVTEPRERSNVEEAETSKTAQAESNPEPENRGGILAVRCPRCGQVVADFKEMRRDALYCPACGDLLRPAP